MRVALAGKGRIGTALSRAMRQAGHDVVFARLPTTTQATCDALHNTASATSNIGGADLLIVATPARVLLADSATAVSLPANDDLDGKPVAVVGMIRGLHSGRKRFPGSPLTRFHCSAAVTDPNSIRFIDEDGDARATELLLEALPSKSWQRVESNNFDRFGLILAGAALACAPLAAIQRELEPLALEDAELLQSTLTEAQRLIAAFDGDVAAAFHSALTPSGLTEDWAQRLFRDAALARILPGETAR